MNFEKTLLFLLFALVFVAISSIDLIAQTPTISASTNYVATGCRLTITGSGFAANEYINVFVNGPRIPITEIGTDSNGCFSVDLTYNGPYCSTNIQYRLNPAVEGGVYTTNVYYQAAETPAIKGNIGFAYSTVTNPNGLTLTHIKVTAHVGVSGSYYDLYTATNLAPACTWQRMNMSRNNDTMGEKDLVWDFETAQNQSAFFRVGNIVN